jgi:hypothetical protein
MAYGFEQSLWMKESGTYGTAEDMSVGTRPVILCRPNISLAKTFERIQIGHLRGGGASIQYEEDAISLESVAGSITGVVPVGQSLSGAPESSGFLVLLKHLLGKVVTTGAATPYTHRFYWNDKLFPGFSIAHNLCGATYIYDGMQVGSLKLSGEIGGPLEFTYSFIGKTERQVAAITAVASQPVYNVIPAYWLIQHITAKIDTIAVDLAGIDYELANEIESGDDRSYNLGSAARSCLVKSGHTVKGTFSRRHKRDSANVSKFYAKFLSGANAALEINLVHPTDPGNFSGKIVLPYTKLMGKTPEASDSGWIMEESPFEAFTLNDATNYIEILDSSSTPVTATGAYDGT